MEVVEIKSAHSLITSMTASRPSSACVYKVHCGQFTSAYRNWQKDATARERPLAVMTLGFDRIWLTAEEVEQVVTAIRATQSPVVLR